MASYDQTPGTLNLSFKRADDFSAMVDFSISLASYTVTAGITSLVSGAEVQPLTVSFVSATAGQLTVSLTDTQTAVLARGTYGWSLKWTESTTTRTALAGFVEVL
jgi:hypothetical protein